MDPPFGQRHDLPFPFTFTTCPPLINLMASSKRATWANRVLKAEKSKPSPVIPALPDELLSMIAERADDPYDLRCLRLANRALSYGASKAIFGSLTKCISMEGLQDLRKLSQSKHKIFVKSLKLRAQYNINLVRALHSDPNVLHNMVTRLRQTTQAFVKLSDISFVFAEVPSMTQLNWQDVMGEIMYSACSTMVSNKSSQRLHVRFVGHAGYDELQQSWVGSEDDYEDRFKEFLTNWKDVSFVFDTCNCMYGKIWNLPADFDMCAGLESLELSSNISWMVLQDRADPNAKKDAKYNLPALKHLSLAGVFCTSTELVGFMESSRSSLTHVTLTNVILLSVTDVAESKWADVFDFLATFKPNLVDFNYSMLTVWGSKNANVYPTIEPIDKEGLWKFNPKVICGVRDHEKASLGQLLNVVEGNSKKAGLKPKRDAMDDIYRKLAKSYKFLAERGARPRRAAAVKAEKSISTYMKVDHSEDVHLSRI